MFPFFRIERPTNAILRPQSTPDVGRLLHPVHVRGERRDEDPALAPREDLAERLPHHALGLRDAGPLGVRGVAEQEVDAAATDLGELADVGALPVDRRVVELVVARVDAAAAGRLEHDRGRIRDRVRHADELDPERAEVDGIVAGSELLQLGRAEEPVLVELRLDQREREPRRDHTRHAHLPHEERQGADVILVPVREHDRAHEILAVAEVREVGQDEVDAEMLVAREGKPRVDDDDRAVRLVDGHVLPDLAETAERDDPAYAHRR